jgi:hypothetical protein
VNRFCEVCARLDVSRRPREARALVRLLAGDRIVALCGTHAEMARLANATTLDELRALFAELGGRRSLVDRRSPIDRRLFPPRPEGRRRALGRRASDKN